MSPGISQRARTRTTLILISLVFSVLTIRLFRLVSQYAVNLFYWDQWDFNDATVFQYHPLWEIFRWQHGPHRQGLGALLSVFLEPWFNWNSRTEAFLATSLVVVAALCALYLKYRLFGSFQWTDIVIPIILLSTAQWESLWNTVNLSHGILPLLLIILYCLIWTLSHDRTKFALITILNFGIIYTGFGFFIGILTPVLLAVSYRAKTAATKLYLAVCITASLASLASFFVGYHNDPASGCSSLFAPSPLQYFWFMDLLYAHPFGIRGIGIYSKTIGAVVLAAVVLAAAVSWKHVLTDSAKRTISLAPAVFGACSILFGLSAAVGRTCLGLTAAHASRYSIYTGLGLLSLYFCALAVKPARLPVALPAILLLALIPTLRVSPFDARGMQLFSSSKTAWRACYLEGHPIEDCDRAFRPIYPEPEKTHLKEKLDFLEETHQNLFSDSR